MLLTKSKYRDGLQCPRYLWMLFHEKEKIPEHDLTTEYNFKQGNDVGKLAKKLFPTGVDLPEESESFRINIQKTQELIKKRKTIFEAGIISGNIYARADVLVPVEKDEWDIIEVKASARVKDNHIHDVSFQKHVYETSGLKIRKCFLLHINNQYVKNGEIKPKELFIQDEITSEVNEAIVGIQERIDTMIDIANNLEAPNVSIGNGCNLGLNCPSEKCWNFLPNGNIFELTRGGKKSLELLEAEIFAIKDIPDNFKLNNKQQIQRGCARTGKTYSDKEKIKKFLDELEYPLNYIDFEAFQTAIPLYDETRPYQQIPFQFSLYIDNGKKLEHFEYLHENKEDPREKFLLEMKKVLGDRGSIIVYNRTFEIARLEELAQVFPKYETWINLIIERIVDLWIPFRNFDYYNPQQKGSSSIKTILPAVTGKNYKHLDIDGGQLAAVCYFESIFGNLNDKEKDKIRDDLLKYCGLDTEGMVHIVNKLRTLVE